MTTEKQQLLLAYLGYYRLRRKDGTLAIDGITGPATKQAIYNFQLAHSKRPDGSLLDTDGTWGPATERAVRQVLGTGEEPQQPKPAETVPGKKGYKWIDPGEFRCRCGGQYCNGWPAQPHQRTMDLLEQFGAHFGRKPVVHSGLRCDTWNRLQGGSPTSKHRLGMAVDFHIDGVSVEALAAYAEELMPGWGGIGKYNWGVHIDDRPVKGRWDNRGR